MHTDHERCYRVISSREKRFDGRFVTAVTSTGIYCRPSCPAQTPKRENVRFLPGPAAAVAAGFRACKRCRPEAAAGTRDWDVRADLAARALRGVAAGALDGDGDVGTLATSLHVSERQLHRSLVAEVGVGPLALARTRRAQTARLLLDATDLPLSEIAFAAGFTSIRQFNDTMREHFGAAPRDLRRASAPPLDASGTLTVRVAHRTPYDVEAMLGWLALHVVPGLEEVDGSAYRRVMPDSTVTTTRLAADAATVTLSLDDVQRLPVALAAIRRLLDSDADPAAVADVLSRDPLLAGAVADRPGLRVPGSIDAHELAVRAVLGQQVSLAAAHTFAGRLVAAYGRPLAEPTGALTAAFPSPEALADADLSEIGLTGSRARTVSALSAAVASGELTLDPAADRAATRQSLLALPGIGPWTADYVAMRGLGDPDVFPATDLALRRVLDADATPDTDPERWSPWRSYAAMHLWLGYLDTNRRSTP